MWGPLAIQFLVTLNWGVAVAWSYWEALKPGYPAVHVSPLGMQLYVLVSFLASAFFVGTPILFIGYLITPQKPRVLSLANLAICAASLLLSALQLWLFRLMHSPPIHAI
jgi:hypothetical protein